MSRLKEMPKEDLPRERLQRNGATSLSNAELVAILLRTGMVGTHVLDLASSLLKKYQTLAAISRCSVKELRQIKGIGPAKAVQLATAFALGNRLVQECVITEPFDNPALIFQMLGGELRALPHESLRVIMLDTKFHLIRIEEVSKGSVSETIAHVPSLFKPIILSNAYAFIIVHNHPSGNPDPSRADQSFTRRVSEVAQLMQIRFLDHIICGAPTRTSAGYYSFREAGII